jgi:uncharacterized protein
VHPDVQIREVDPDDLDSIMMLNREAVPAVGDIDERAMWRLVEQSSPTLVAEDTAGGGVVAFVIALGPGVEYDSPNYRFFADRYPSFRYVDRVVVDPAYARRGIGARLYEAVAEAATADGAEVLTAEVNVRPPNQASLAFHAAHGFAGVGEQDTEGGAKRVRLFVREL